MRPSRWTASRMRRSMASSFMVLSLERNHSKHREKTMGAHFGIVN
ncbi:hypothetical protein RHECNPAF_23300101 [Rhizobium etli CNPAF512]|nr:hypothetical protein RHECNPAF_23300101 [Rhizobium etli CNPAF512]